MKNFVNFVNFGNFGNFKNIERFVIFLLFLIFTSSRTTLASEISEDSDGQGNLVERNRSSSGTAGSLDELKFVICDDERYRPHGPSIHRTPTKTSHKHVSFGWVQFSDDRMMPSEDMPDTPLNREHVRVLLLADARHGNLEYFRYLVRVWNRMNFRSNIHEEIDTRLELSLYNQESLIFAAVLGDNRELFLEAMAFKGVTFEDLNPFKSVQRPKSEENEEERFSPHSYPPKKRSYLLDDGDDDDNDSDSDSHSENETDNIDETVFGVAIMKNSHDIVQLLLENGIKDDYQEGTETALHLAIRHGHDNIVRILLEQGNSRIERFNGALQTPLITAILHGQPRIVQTLVDYHASLHAIDHDNKSALHHAAAVGNLEILTILKGALVEMGKMYRDALIYGLDLKRRTPLQYALNEQVRLFMMKELGIKE